MAGQESALVRWDVLIAGMPDAWANPANLFIYAFECVHICNSYALLHVIPVFDIIRKLLRGTVLRPQTSAS